jgi:hypothetical protein
VQIVVLKQLCRHNPDKCDPVLLGDRSIFHLRRVNQLWAVLIWDSPDARLGDDVAKPEKF